MIRTLTREIEPFTEDEYSKKEDAADHNTNDSANCNCNQKTYMHTPRSQNISWFHFQFISHKTELIGDHQQ